MTSKSPSPLGWRTEMMSLMFYAVVLLITLSTLAATFTRYPLFPPDSDSIGWSNAWLLAKTIDCYGICMCFCGIILSTEESWWTACAWISSCCVIGSPACCLYVFLWLTKESGSLRLERTEATPAVIGCSNKPKESGASDHEGGGGGAETKSGTRPTVTSTVAIAASHACVGLMKGTNPSTPTTHPEYQDDTIVSTTSTSSTIDHHNPASISSNSNNNRSSNNSNSRNQSNNNLYHPQQQFYRQQPYPQYQQRQQLQPQQQQQRQQDPRQQQQQQQRPQPQQQQQQQHQQLHQQSGGINSYRTQQQNKNHKQQRSLERLYIS